MDMIKVIIEMKKSIESFCN
uniref:Uncharacterized protein n=1 Tax=Anguilla anguilla TaxID=7936 RepID=A0A0E9UW88_ANGAN